MSNDTRDTGKWMAVANLLSRFPWASEGYADSHVWLRELYGPLPDAELVWRLVDQFDKEGLL